MLAELPIIAILVRVQCVRHGDPNSTTFSASDRCDCTQGRQFEFSVHHSHELFQFRITDVCFRTPQNTPLNEMGRWVTENSSHIGLVEVVVSQMVTIV